jgi:branched-chain amino acid transport system substrate-binding protein
MIKKLLALICLAILLQTTSLSAQNTPIKIGVILPLTGDFAYFGAQAKIGIDAALRELNATGTQIKVVYEDDKCLPKDGLRAFKKLISVDKVDQVLGPVCTGSILAVAEGAKSMKRYFLALLDANRPVANSGEFTYAIGYSSEEEAELVAEHVRVSGYSAIGIIYEDDAWAVGVKDAFRNKLSAIGGSIVSEESQVITGGVSALDYKPVITKVIKNKPDALFVVPAYNGGFFVKQLRAMGITLPIFGPDTFGVTEVIEIAKDAANGIVYANAIIPEKNPAALKLELALTKYLKRAPNSIFYAGLGYDGLKILAQIATSEKTFPEAAAGVDLSTTVLGLKAFNNERQSKLPPALYQIKGQKSVRF